MSSTPNVSIPEVPSKSALLKNPFLLRGRDDYERLRDRARENPEEFWSEVASRQLLWRRGWDQVSDCDFHQAKIRWFLGAELNVSENCLDRHLESRGEKKALIWIGNEPHQERVYTFRELHRLRSSPPPG